MEDIRTPFLGFLTAQAPTRRSTPSNYTIQLDLLAGFIQLVIERILTNDLPLEEELWLIDLVDGLKTEQEIIEEKLAGADKEKDPLLGWHLHLRSQSGFELLE